MHVLNYKNKTPDMMFGFLSCTHVFKKVTDVTNVSEEFGYEHDTTGMSRADVTRN
jgi:hypothetical protein